MMKTPMIVCFSAAVVCIGSTTGKVMNNMGFPIANASFLDESKHKK